MKKADHIRLKPLSYFLIVAFIISFIVTGYGIFILIQVKNSIKNGVLEAAEIFTNNDETPHDTPANYEINNQQKDNSDAVAVMTFIDADNSKVGIFNGITNDVLRKGAGRDTNTAFPNTIGNCVLYAHRDSGFQPLVNIKENDKISIQTKDNTIYYRVSKTRITTPNDKEIYSQSSKRHITMVTCYPFSYVGPAPKRFVVSADEL